MSSFFGAYPNEIYANTLSRICRGVIPTADSRKSNAIYWSYRPVQWQAVWLLAISWCWRKAKIVWYNVMRTRAGVIFKRKVPAPKANLPGQT
jgi:hypothetical protein